MIDEFNEYVCMGCKSKPCYANCPEIPDSCLFGGGTKEWTLVAESRQQEIDRLKAERDELRDRYKALLQVSKNIVAGFTNMDLTIFYDDEDYLARMEEK